MELTREQMAQRVAREMQDGYYVNLGIGIPTLVANYVPEGIDVMLQSENGLLGMGAFPTEETIDADMISTSTPVAYAPPWASTSALNSTVITNAITPNTITSGRVARAQSGTMP